MFFDKVIPRLIQDVSSSYEQQIQLIHANLRQGIIAKFWTVALGAQLKLEEEPFQEAVLSSS